MSRKHARFLALLLSIAVGMLVGGAGSVAAQSAEDPSAVVLVFDVSNSIIGAHDGTNVEFAAALEDIADRVATISSDLTAGNATVSFVAFGRTAIPYPPGCQQLQLHDDPAAVASFEDCLSKTAAEYRAGPKAPVKQSINTAGTDHVAALEKAASLLPQGSSRSSVIFFTDGQNDPPGTARDNENVVEIVTPSFAGQTSLAILPVGLGPRAGAFESELQAYYDAFFRDMAPCEGRSTFSWPQIVFPSGGEAGAAVALALQEVTCSFTVAPTPIPSAPPTATPAPTPTAVPTPVPTPEPVIVPPGCTAGFFECNPWALWAAAGGGVLAILVALLSGGRLFSRRNRVWVTAQVDGGPNRALGWGPQLGVGLEQDDEGWHAVKRRDKSAPIQVRYQGNNRFLVQSAAGIRDVHQGDPATVRGASGETHQLILRRYARRKDEEAPEAAIRRAPAPADPRGEEVAARIDGSQPRAGAEEAASPPVDTPWIGGDPGKTPEDAA